MVRISKPSLLGNGAVIVISNIRTSWVSVPWYDVQAEVSRIVGVAATISKLSSLVSGAVALLSNRKQKWVFVTQYDVQNQDRWVFASR